MNYIKLIPIQTTNSKSIANFKKQVGQLYLNGGLIIQQFEIDKLPNPQSDTERIEFVNAILSSSELLEAQPKLTDISVAESKHYSRKWSTSIPLLKEQLSQDINWAGAYTSINIREAKRLAQTFVQWIDSDDILYIDLGHDWSRWFCNIVWDYSYLILNSDAKIVTLLCATDTD